MARDGDAAFAAHVQRLLYQLVRAYERCDQQCLAQLGVTAAQAYTLLALPEATPATMNELSQAMGLANSTMTRMVDHLVKKDLVGRRPDDEDRRVVRVALTARGQELRRALEEAQQELVGQVLEDIEPRQRSGILSALEKVTQAMKKAVSVCCGN
ncbi:MAG: MarR family transcriptional regulator [Chloroflexi bacterium]|nr:MarR family transcriptional regulator [Chloroflexota bacterium]